MNNADMPATPIFNSYASAGRAIDEKGCTTDTRMTGLTKREAFAMAAMQGWLSRCANVPHTHELKPEIMAEVSVSMADALLKELDKE